MPETPGTTPTVAEMVRTAEPTADLYGLSKYTVVLSENKPNVVDESIGLAYVEAAQVGISNRIAQRDLKSKAEVATAAKSHNTVFEDLLQTAPHLARNETFINIATNAARATREADWELSMCSQRAYEVRNRLYATHEQSAHAVEIVLKRERLGKLFRKVAFGIGALSAATVFLLGAHRDSRDMTILHNEHASIERIASTEHEYTEDNAVYSALIGGVMWLGAARGERKVERRLVKRRAALMVQAAKRRHRRQQLGASSDENDSDIAP